MDNSKYEPSISSTETHHAQVSRRAERGGHILAPMHWVNNPTHDTGDKQSFFTKNYSAFMPGLLNANQTLTLSPKTGEDSRWRNVTLWDINRHHDFGLNIHQANEAPLSIVEND